ncbi:MAG: hypothetical protein QFC55_05940 [Chloroflexota bacterium]|nr:hypothetical protein [Chloroflexota bacterium]
MERIFLDTSVLIRYFASDDPPRTLAAARLIDSNAAVVVSTPLGFEPRTRGLKVPFPKAHSTIRTPLKRPS